MKKKRSGADPLDFIKDTSDISGENEIEVKRQEEKEDNLNVKNKISITVEESSVGIGTVTFDGDMSIYNSKQIQNVLCSSVGDYKQFNVELSRVKKIDSSGFQLLLSALKEVKFKNKVINLIKPSKEIKNIFNLFGEEQLLKEMTK